VLLLAGAAIAYAVTRDTKGATPLAQSSSPSPTLTPSAGTPSTPGQSPSQTPPHNHHGHPVAGTGGGSTQPGGTSTQPGGATTPPTSASSSPSAGGHHRTGGGGGTKVAAPGAPQSVFSGHVSIASRSSSSQQPTAITVTMSWAAPARGGKVAKYCVQRTVMQGSSAVSPAYASGCTSATSFSGTIVALNQGDSWLKWQVQAQNATGKSTWVTARALVPYLIGGKDYDGTQKLRGAGLRPNYATAGKPSQASDANKVTDESPTGGSLTGGSFVSMKSYDDYS
jgi:hypothetical protein